MWNWFNCYLSGRHEFGVWCAPGTIFLRCVHCGKRSGGIAIEPRLRHTAPAPPATLVSRASGIAASAARVVPFARAAAGR